MPNPSTLHYGLTCQADNYTLHCGYTTMKVTCLNRAVGFEVSNEVKTSDGSSEVVRTYDVLSPSQATDLAHAINRCLMAALEADGPAV
tara:strand:+ start:32889 stop:33152 length:264 start_codon:yes stop_codon:yes gene_type:complete